MNILKKKLPKEFFKEAGVITRTSVLLNVIKMQAVFKSGKLKIAV